MLHVMRCITLLPVVAWGCGGGLLGVVCGACRNGRRAVPCPSERAALWQHQALSTSAVGQQHVANLVVFQQYAAKAAALAAAAAAVWLAYDPRAIYLTRRMRGALLDLYG